VATDSAEVPDGHSDHDAGHREYRQRPPGRCAVKPETPWEVVEDPALKLADQEQEAVRRRGDRHAENRREHQESEVGLAAQKCDGIGAGARR